MTDKTENEMHPVVILILKRAASHPEEVGTGKWSWVVAEIMKNGNAEERAAVEPIVKKAALDNVHKQFMRELLNPEQVDLFTVGGMIPDINPLRQISDINPFKPRSNKSLSETMAELAHRQAQAMKLK